MLNLTAKCFHLYKDFLHYLQRASSKSLDRSVCIFFSESALIWLFIYNGRWSIASVQMQLKHCESWKKNYTPYESMLFAYTLQSTNKCYDLMIPFLWDSNYVEFLLRNNHMLFSSWNCYYELQKYLILLAFVYIFSLKTSVQMCYVTKVIVLDIEIST